MATATLERPQIQRANDCSYLVWHRDLKNTHAIADSLDEARLIAMTWSEDHGSLQVQVLRHTDGTQDVLIGWAKGGVWHGAVA